MESSGNDTLDRIQREIQEALEREEELRQKYNLLNNNNNNNNDPKETNGFTTPSPEPPPTARAPTPTSNGAGSRMFLPNPSSKGVMQKFLKMRGKLNLATIQTKAEPQSAIWMPDDAFEPAKVTLEAAGKPLRNGFVPAEEKMRRELQEFQKREAELRLERKKSQPDLMAALEREQEVETNLRPARSMAMMYSSEDLTDDSAPTSLKPTRSLAELCDASDEELGTPGTYSLIMQFENLRSQS